MPIQSLLILTKTLQHTVSNESFQSTCGPSTKNVWKPLTYIQATERMNVTALHQQRADRRLSRSRMRRTTADWKL